MKKLLAVILSVLLILSLSGCGGKDKADDKTASKPSKPAYWSELQNSADELCNKYVSADTKVRISGIINDINPIMEPAWSDFYYEYRRTESDSLTAIGIEGLPVLLSVLERENAAKGDLLYGSFLRGVFFAVCRTDIKEAEAIEELASDEDRELSVEFYRYAKKRAAEIISSDKSTAEKIIELRHFGILSIPEVRTEIDKGDKEFESYFTAIGLHLSVPEFMNIIADSESTETTDTRYDKIKAVEGSAEFNYTVWLNKNEMALDTFFKFMNEYSANK
ncbi:MAG: hypothetical protein IJW27_01875 [Clostridia bacterium]|nr:hypothetical protein [Clostridia bacterium]